MADEYFSSFRFLTANLHRGGVVRRVFILRVGVLLFSLFSSSFPSLFG